MIFGETKKEKRLSDYYNRYHYLGKVETHLRYGFYKAKDKEIINKLRELKKYGKVMKIQQVEPDLNIIDGVEMDKIKLTFRRISDIIMSDFKNKLTIKRHI